MTRRSVGVPSVDNSSGADDCGVAGDVWENSVKPTMMRTAITIAEVMRRIFLIMFTVNYLVSMTTNKRLENYSLEVWSIVDYNNCLSSLSSE